MSKRKCKCGNITYKRNGICKVCDPPKQPMKLKKQNDDTVPTVLLLPNELKLTIDLTDRPNIFDALRIIAKRDVRQIEEQIIFYILISLKNEIEIRTILERKEDNE